MANFTVVYDACLLYPAAIRDLVVELARTGMLRAKWTDRIHAEWIKAVIRQRPELDRARLQHVAALMNSAVPDCLVTGFEPLEASLSALPDPNDRHVLAAAIHCGAQEIVTFNLRDFPEAVLQPYGIRALHPDVFVEHLLDLNAEAVCEAIRKIRRRLAKPPHTAEEMLVKYESQGLAVSASILRSRINSL
ncbi:MAG: PIN domain-containing protein [Proteobacteria bacterium]|nr:PIN domain-containing protein [Pseudomonadota bacterium]